MKIIDLLNKIANGEEAPKKIKWGVHEFTLWEGNYINYEESKTGNNGTKFYKDLDDYIDFSKWALNSTIEILDEVEIIEEEKKIPEKLEDYYLDKKGKYPIELTMYEQILRNKINEIIDYLKSKGEE